MDRKGSVKVIGDTKALWDFGGAVALLGMQKANADRSPTENVMWLEVVPLTTRGTRFLSDRCSGLGVGSSVTCSKVVDTDKSAFSLSMRNRT